MGPAGKSSVRGIDRRRRSLLLLARKANHWKAKHANLKGTKTHGAKPEAASILKMSFGVCGRSRDIGK